MKQYTKISRVTIVRPCEKLQLTYIKTESDIYLLPLPIILEMIICIPLPDRPVVSSEGNKGVWTGLVNDTIWDHSGQTVSYIPSWGVSQPHNDGLEDCTILGFDELWYDKFCSNEYGFICEKENEV